jgi:hypothetical protein
VSRRRLDTAGTVEKPNQDTPSPAIVVLTINEHTSPEALAKLKACIVNAERANVQFSRQGLFFLAKLSW